MKSVTLLFNQLLRDVHSQSWNEDELAKLSGVELQALAKLFACPCSGSGNKRQLAAGLLTWRNRCRLNGQKFLAEMHAAITARPRQLELSF